jgi:5-methylcytosine-specific restriction endonuclease McrA
MAKTREEYNAYMREYQAKRYHTRRAFFIAEMGGKCAQCGRTEDLEFDHINPEEKSFNVGDRLSNRSEENIRAELEKCQLLCKTCHKDKSVKSRSYDHGEGLTGKRNCRCKLCGPLKNAYMLKFKRARKEKEALESGT